MKKLHFIATIASIAFALNISAQHRCGQPEAEQLLNADPFMREQIKKATEAQDLWLKNFIDTPKESRSDYDYIIPVVFHVFHNHGQENISEAQVKDAIRILNEDFQLKNSDTTNAANAFKSILGNARIEFRLAQLDPQGNCTNGIVRIASSETYVGANYWNNTSTSSLSRWPREKYLNIWVVDNIDNGSTSGGYTAGYTYRPGNTSSSIDGIMILHKHTGSIGTSSISGSRTLTHEVGHWINLAHTWGNSNTPGLAENCNGDDGVSDTPNTIGWASGCNLSAVSCTTLDNVQNYMDYASCSMMFTQGQATRLRAALTSTVAQRSSLWQNSNLISTGVLTSGNLCKAEFKTNRTDICAGQTINYQDASYNDPTQWNWSFSGGTPASSAQQNPSVTYTSPGLYNVQLTVTNPSGTKSTVKENMITVLNPIGQPGPVRESFENFSSTNPEWLINNPDGKATWSLANVGSNGSKSMWINNFSNTAGSEDELISKTYDISSFSALRITFKVAYAQKSSSSSDVLKLLISTNCGESWILRWSRSGSELASVSAPQSVAFTPTTDEWKSFSISNLPLSYLTTNFRMKFIFTSGNGNNIYVDDLNIFDPNSTVGVEQEITNLNTLSINPNPFSNEAMIGFSLNKTENINMSLTDLLGKEYLLLSNQALQAGNHTFKINKSEMNLTTGVYFLKLISDGKPVIKKFIIK
jgi:PKD repeat protein